jgi:Xaa-Pro dipeptidase
MAMSVKPVQSGPVAIIEHEVPAKLRGAMIDAGHDALVAFSQDNVTYTAGFLVPSHASNRFRRTITVLAQDKFAAQIVVNVEENLARQRSRFSDIRAYNQFTQDPADVLADALLEAGVGSGQIAMELDYMPAQDYIRLRERLPRARFVPCRELYFNVRMIKTEAEITLLREVGTLTDRVMGQVLRETRVGMTEKSVAQSIGNRMLEGGCDGFKCQVGSGARSGITNCTPTDKRIEEGDILRVEILERDAHGNGRCADAGATRNLARADRSARGLQVHAEAGHRSCRPLSHLRRLSTKSRDRAHPQVPRPWHRPDHS